MKFFIESCHDVLRSTIFSGIVFFIVYRVRCSPIGSDWASGGLDLHDLRIVDCEFHFCQDRS